MGKVRDMYFKGHLSAATAVQSSGDPGPSRSLVLAVGDLSAWKAAGRGPVASRELVTAAFHDVTEALLAETDPRLVVSPLITRSFDCVDLAVLLGRLGYRGRYRAVGAGLPRPAIVEAEIRGLVPMLDFGVLPMPEWGELD